MDDVYDVEEIPEPVHLGDRHINNTAFKIVIFDLETASLTANTDIIQIAAVCEQNEFSQYVTPVHAISHKSTEVTGLSCHVTWPPSA